MSKVYRLEFEVVTDPAMVYMFKKTHMSISVVDESYWHKVVKEDTNPWQQYNTLCEWERTGEEPIRNVKLFEAEKIEADWKLVQKK